MLRPAICYLAEWIESTDLVLRHETTSALLKLSSNVKNCRIIYETGVSKVENIIDRIAFFP